MRQTKGTNIFFLYLSFRASQVYNI